MHFLHQFQAGQKKEVYAGETFLAKKKIQSGENGAWRGSEGVPMSSQ